MPGAERLVLAVQGVDLRRDALHLPMIGVEPLDELAGEGLDLRDLHHLRAVQVELGEHGIEPAGLDREVAQEGRRGADREADVVGIDKTLGAERLGISHEELDRLLPRRALAGRPAWRFRHR